MCCCFRGRSLNFTTNLYVNFISIHIPTLHTLFSFIPTDHEIAHQWSGNPHSWDSIYQHQRKPQRLLVKLLTNKFNTKTSHTQIPTFCVCRQSLGPRMLSFYIKTLKGFWQTIPKHFKVPTRKRRPILKESASNTEVTRQMYLMRFSCM